ncbi:MAG: hypothetical protein HY822_07310 [Acidobacteria bacterium]|nr:hypothetical protein [Acidobacteriota bacterium]
MPGSKRFLVFFVVAPALAYLGFVLMARYSTSRAPAEPSDEWMERQLEFERVYGGTAVRIIQFYSPEGDLMEGDSTVICYGVVNAKSVRIEPPVEGVGVALNRCVSVAPEDDTRYTLVAEGKDGSAVSESFVIRTHPDPYTLPHIKRFGILRAASDGNRKVFLLSFEVQNAEEVSVEPRAFPTLHGAPYGRFYVMPEKTTTYTLTVVGKKGRTVRQQLKIEVPGEV